MNLIPIEQNEPRQLERLSAQRELYSAAKKGYTIQIFGNVVIPIALSVFSFFQFQIALATSIFGIIFFVIDLLVITPNITKKKLKAAKIQELFDCDILKIPKSYLKSADDITVEEVLTYYQAHSKISSNVEKVKDWYSVEVGAINIVLARIICQRTNCWWDKKMRSDYIESLRITSIFIPLLTILIGTIANMPLAQVVLITSGLMPLFRFANKEYSEHKSASSRLDKTISYIDKIWSQILDHSYNRNRFDSDARMIQDEIFEHRSRSPLMLDKLYWYFRPNSERMMNNSAKIFVQQVIASQADF